MYNAWESILDFFKKIGDFIIESGLAKDTVETIGRIITEIDEELIPLMWDWIHKFFGA